MDHFLLDPYEQQLLKVFNSHDRENCGSLDRDGLAELCQTLQLEEQGPELIKSLLKDKQSRASFIEFKDALLMLLGKMQSGKTESPKKEASLLTDSPEREVSPKYVYGSKKYGRRSRPKTDESNDENDQSLPNKTVSVQRSNSQSEVSSKKRKTSYKLKRCTSLPGQKDLSPTIDNHIIPSNLSSEPELVCTEDMLREAWKKLGVGEDGFLNQTELVLVCDAIGLHKLADGVIRSLSDKLSMNYDQKISFNEVLEAIQRDETWFDVLNQTTTSESINLRCSSDNLFPDSRTFQYVTLGPDGNGIINTDTLIEMWENIGIHSPKELIHELGFNARRINVQELSEVLEKQTRSITESTRSEFQSPHLTLLQANLSLYQSEIKCFKHILEQLHAEREKLKGDVVEANNRATLLAQEVDDNHTKMEKNTAQQVKLLELRHSEMLKEITSQYSKDKDQLTSINRVLEERISTLETEALKLKNDLAVAQKYSINVEKENHTLNGKINELERDKSTLSQQIGMLETEKHNVREQDREETEMLLGKLQALQIKNSELKDRNDEMEAEIESLTNQVMTMKSKASSTPTRNYNTLDQSMEDNISIIYEGVGVGAKRRSDLSPSKDVQLLKMTDGSPRLGKVRKFYTTKKNPTDATLEVPFTTSSGESGFDTEPESLSASSCTELNSENEVNRLQAKVVFLEQILIQHNIPVPSDEDTETNIENIMQLKSRVQELEQIIDNAKTQMASDRPAQDCLNCERLREVCANLENRNQDLTETDVDEILICEQINKNYADQSNQTELGVDCVDGVESNVKKLEKENQELKVKCEELEDCIELLRNEYEKCEDYWQSKVDEERQYFEAEQKISGDKLTELLEKMREYEEQYANQDALDNRLPPIVEAENLEKQFMDLEQEFEDYKVYHETEMFKKDEEISILKEKLTELALRQKQMTEAAVQVDPDFVEEQRILSKMRDLSYNVTETTSRVPEEMVPEITVSVPSLSPTGSSNGWAQQNQRFSVKMGTQVSNAHSLPLSWNFVPDTSSQQLRHGPSTSSSQISTPCRPKRTRKHDKNMYKKNPQDKDQQKKTEFAPHEPPKTGAEQNVVVPVSTFNNLMARKNYLEQRVRHLQLCMKQQHYHTEQTLQFYWQQFRGEKADLHTKLKYCQEKLDQQMRICNEQLEKLHRNDIFVKDLYVENAYLFANVERLEKQCRLLTQNNTSNSM